jgi:hypothetical protein
MGRALKIKTLLKQNIMFEKTFEKIRIILKSK